MAKVMVLHEALGKQLVYHEPDGKLATVSVLLQPWGSINFLDF